MRQDLNVDHVTCIRQPCIWFLHQMGLVPLILLTQISFGMAQTSPESPPVDAANAIESVGLPDEHAIQRFEEEQIEEAAESIGTAFEAWADQFGEDAEVWAESFGEQVEQWAEQYSQQWEQWAEGHAEAWTSWAETYQLRWNEWGESFQQPEKLTAEQLNGIMRENLEMMQKMPLKDLYRQLAKSPDQFKDFPWQRLKEAEDIMRDAIRRSLDGMERVQGELTDVPARELRMRALHDELRNVHQGLDVKRLELEAAAARELAELHRAKLAQLNSLQTHSRREQELARQLEATAREIADQQRASMEVSRAQVQELRAEQDALAARLGQLAETGRESAEQRAEYKVLRDMLQAKQAAIEAHVAQQQAHAKALAAKHATKALKRTRPTAEAMDPDPAEGAIRERAALHQYDHQLEELRREVQQLRTEIEALRQEARAMLEVQKDQQ